MVFVFFICRHVNKLKLQTPSLHFSEIKVQKFPLALFYSEIRFRVSHSVLLKGPAAGRMLAVIDCCTLLPLLYVVPSCTVFEETAFQK